MDVQSNAFMQIRAVVAGHFDHIVADVIAGQSIAAFDAAGICLVERGLLERIRDYDVDDGIAIDDWNDIVDALAHGQSGEEGT